MVVVQNVIISRNYPIFVKFHIRGGNFISFQGAVSLIPRLKCLN